MTFLQALIDRYPNMPWLAVLRYLEVDQARQQIALCRHPILDLGCGDGFIAGLVFQKKLEAGVDLDAEMVRRAKISGQYAATLTADARRMPFNDATFNTVYSNGAMEHMDQLENVLIEIARVLKPGGILITLVPSDRFETPVGKFGKVCGRRIWRSYNRLHHHVNLLSPEAWSRLLARVGLHAKSISRYGGPAIAEVVTNYDLLSKIDVIRRWPFLRLTHGGRMARFLPNHSTTWMAKLLQKERSEHENGFWLRVIATRV